MHRPGGRRLQPGYARDPDEAQEYDSVQVGTFADTAADMVTAITMTYAEEGVGVARAAAANGIPSVISLTVETDGRLPSGQPLGQAIAQVDEETGGSLNVLGGCCGTGHRHVDAIARAWGADGP